MLNLFIIFYDFKLIDLRHENCFVDYMGISLKNSHIVNFLHFINFHSNRSVRIYFSQEYLTSGNSLTSINSKKEEKKMKRCFMNTTIILAVLIVFFSCGSDGVKFEKMEKQQWLAAGFNIDQAKEWKRAGFGFISALQWKQANFTADKATAWRSSHFNYNDAYRWKSAGFDLDMAKRWQAAGFSFHEAAPWKSQGLSIDKAKEWKNIGFDAQLAKQWNNVCETADQARELLAAGFQKSRFEEVLCFKDKGYTLDDIKRLKEKDIDCRAASKWQDAGFSIEETFGLIKAGFDPRSSIKNAQNWKNAGFSSAEIIALKESGFSEYATDAVKSFKDEGYATPMIIQLKKADIDLLTVKKWKQEGFSVEETLSWVNLGIRRDWPHIAKYWKDSGLQLTQIQELVDNGFSLSSPHQYLDYQKLDLTFTDILALKKKNYMSYEIKHMMEDGIKIANLIAWTEAGMSKTDTKDWIASGCSIDLAQKLKNAGYSPGEVDKLKKKGLTPNDVLAWQQKGETKAVADQWLFAGFKFEEAQQWLSSGIKAADARKFKDGNLSPSNAKAWKDAGYSAEEAVRWKRKGFDLNKIANLSQEDKLIYSFDFNGLYFGMDEMAAAKKLDEIARQYGCNHYGGVVFNNQRVAILSVLAKDKKLNYISYHPIFTDIPFNGYGMDQKSATAYIKKQYGIKLNENGSYNGKKLKIRTDNFMLCFDLR